MAGAVRLWDTLGEIGVLPVVVLDDPAQALPLGRALAAGGIPCAEITLRTPAGMAAIRQLSELDGFALGAGTVLSIDQLDAAGDAGAAFAVSPGWHAGIAQRAADRGLDYVPGVATAGEVMTAMAEGLSVLKLFPAAQLGGPGMISALSGPFPDIRFVPSGGIDVDSAASYSQAAVLSVSTSWIAPRALIASGGFDEITERARRFRAAVGR